MLIPRASNGFISFALTYLAITFSFKGGINDYGKL